MAYFFADSFDLYASVNDMLASYWDSGSLVGLISLAAPRFVGQSLALGSASQSLVKSSGVNDSVHHFTCAFRNTGPLSGTSVNTYFQLADGVINQCAVVFRSDGAILLTSGGPTGTTLATYPNAVNAQSVWFAFEFEVVVHNSTGSFKVRRNGNPVDDHSTTGIDTAGGTANNYANKLTVGTQVAPTAYNYIDDFMWRSDATTVPWSGDVRCYPRMPVTDASAQFARTPATLTQQTFDKNSFDYVTNGLAYYVPFTASYTGTIATVGTTFNLAATCNMKCAIFASSGTAPTTVLGTATPLALSSASSATFTFTPVAVVKGTQYWIGFNADATVGRYDAATGQQSLSSTTSYASFPVASPATTGDQGLFSLITITPTTNAGMVSDAQQDGTTTYVYDATPGHQDFYNLDQIATPSVQRLGLVTRGFVAKGDAGTRSGTMQLKSGASTVAAPTLVLSSSFLWSWRTDTLNPATGTAWTDATANAVTAGPAVVA